MCLPNGYLVIEGTKRVQVSSENQVVTVRGVIRPVGSGSPPTPFLPTGSRKWKFR